jgi:enamine deaminase RidA (YjgF/YER057c/UK114 family)
VKTTCLQNLKEVLELSGSSLEQVVKYNGESEGDIVDSSC